jgi:hypothetical protein
MSLWEFSWNFCDFRSIFHAFKQFLDFSRIAFALKINWKKTKPSFLGQARRPDPHPPQPSRRPCGAHLASGHGQHGQEACVLTTPGPCLGVRAMDCACPRPYIARLVLHALVTIALHCTAGQGEHRRRPERHYRRFDAASVFWIN